MAQWYCITSGGKRKAHIRSRALAQSQGSSILRLVRCHRVFQQNDPPPCPSPLVGGGNPNRWSTGFENSSLASVERYCRGDPCGRPGQAQGLPLLRPDVVGAAALARSRRFSAVITAINRLPSYLSLWFRKDLSFRAECSELSEEHGVEESPDFGTCLAANVRDSSTRFRRYAPAASLDFARDRQLGMTRFAIRCTPELPHRWK